MNADDPYSSISRAKKREKLIALIERRKIKERTPLKNRDNTESKNRVKKTTKLKKLNSHFFKKLFRISGQKMKALNDADDVTAKESCLGHRRKKQRLYSGSRSNESFHQSQTENNIESGSGELPNFQFEASTETHDHVLPYVNKLRDYWNRGQNTVFFDEQDRIIKVVLFVSSLLDNMKNPILIVACSNILSLWDIEFSKWSKSKSMDVVLYKGNKDTRAAIRDAEFYNEKGCVKFQVLLSSLDAIIEDMEKLEHIKWELLVIDECQRASFSPHFKKFQMLMADMKLLTVSGEPVDICQSYEHILSLIGCKYKKVKAVSDMETHDNNINTLKEKLSPFIAFDCKFSTRDFEEYWVPVHLSSMQIEQYCSILSSNLEALSSSSRNSSLTDILTKIQKCCDHPYLVDPTLRDSLKKDSLIDPLDAEINVSGKMQLLDKLLLEIKRCGLRALVLFQSAVNSEKISTGQFLDDLVHQRFGENSYVYIPRGKVLSKSKRAKKKESLKIFNSEESEMFVCLLDYRACHSTVRLSRVDAVILFNSVGNPSNDLKALKRINVDSQCEQLNVFRLYSAFTVEEKSLILAKQGKLVNYITLSVCHQLLAWGASYLFQKVQNNSGSMSFLDDLVNEVSSILSGTRVKTGLIDGSMILKAHMQNGVYSDGIVLYGETETHMKENYDVEEYLIDNTPCVFWSNLVKVSQNRPESSSGRLSHRIRKSPQCWFEEGYGIYASEFNFVKVKKRSKRKGHDKVGRKRTVSINMVDAQLPILPSTSVSDSTALNPRTNESQQSQTNQPARNSSSSMPLETEIERIQKERDQITKLHQEKKSMLISECEKEISEIKKKYDALIHDSETSLTKEIKILEDYQELVDSNKLLAEFFSQNWHDNLDLNRSDLKKRKQKEIGPLIIPKIPASALVRPKNQWLIGGPTTNLSARGLAGLGLRAPPPHLRANQSLFASFPSGPVTGEPMLEPLPTLSTTQILPRIQTEPSCPFMEFDPIYDEVGPSLPLLGSYCGSF